MEIDYINSFSLFETRFGQGVKYKEFKLSQIKPYPFLPIFFVDKLKSEGYLEYLKGFWHLIKPDHLKTEISQYLKLENVCPIIKNAFGCFIVYFNSGYYHLDIHTGNFGYLSDNLGIILNATLIDDFALRDMFLMDYFEDALDKFGQVNQDEIYAFNPALQLGGKLSIDSLIKVKAREHIFFLSQL
jgi:hypothetical protein